MDEQIELILAQSLPSASRLILHTFTKILHLENFATARLSSQVLSTYMHGQCDKLVTVVSHQFHQTLVTT